MYTTYEDLKTEYEEFKIKLPQNLYERYTQELKYIRSLIIMAEFKRLYNEVSKYQKIEQNAVLELQKMGYKII